MKKKIMKLLAFVLVFSLIVPFVPAQAAVTPKLNTKAVTITGVGNKYTLKLTAPSGSKAVWSSSNATIASVTSKGIVTAKKKGTATITCSVKTGGKTQKLTCKVTIKVPAKAIRFSNAKIDPEYNAHILEIGTPYDFNAKVISSSKKSASSDWIRFYIDDTSIATVNAKNGIVTPLKAGTTKLHVCAGVNEAAALSPDNTIVYEIGIKVVAPSVSVSSCSLNNAKELAIKFDKVMNTSTLIGSNNTLSSNISITPKTINSTTASDPGALTATMSSDNQTLYIQSANPFNGVYNVQLSTSILSSTGASLEGYNKDLELKDVIAPTYAGSTTDDSGLIAYIKFSEPVDISKLVVTDPKKNDNSIPINSTYFTTASNYKLLEDKMTLAIDLSNIASSDKGSQISVKLAGVVDLAGNVTNPYPLTVYMTTDTSTRPQAVCQSIIRNGNSLVATFSSSIQTPGYAIINGAYVSGVVNTANKKEVIYNLANTGLTSLTGTVSVTLSGFYAYNAPASSSTQYSATVYFSATAVLPNITGSTLTTKTVSGKKQHVLTLTYDKNVTLKAASGTLYATSSIDGVIGAATGYAYTATVKDKEVSVVLTGTFTELGTYTFTIPAEFVKDTYNNYTAQNTVSVVKVSGDTQVLPAPVSIQMDYNSTGILYVTFNNMLDLESAQNVNNYKISGLNIASATVIANSYTAPAIVELRLASGSTIADIPYQITISGIKGYKNSYTAMSTYQDMLTLTSIKTLPITYSGTASSKKIVLASINSISSSSVINYTFTSGGKTLTLKNSPVINGSTITIEFTDTLVSGAIVVMEPAINNSIVDMSNRKALNLAYSVVMY